MSLRSCAFAVYDVCASMRPLYRYVCTAGVGAAFLVGWLFGMYFPLERAIASHRSTSAQLSKRVEQQIAAEASCRSCEASLNEQQLLFDRYALKASAIKSQKNASTIMDTAKKNDLLLRSYSTRNSVDKEWYSRVYTHGEFVGSFKNIVSFLTAVRDSGAMLNCKDVTINRQDEKQFLLSCSFSLLKPKTNLDTKTV